MLMENIVVHKRSTAKGCTCSRSAASGVRSRPSSASTTNVSLAFFYRDHDVYGGLRLRKYDAQTWNNHIPLYNRLVKELRPSACAEVGVWKGGTTAAFAKALKKQGFGKMVAIDTWLGEVGFWGDGQTAQGGVRYTAKRAGSEKAPGAAARAKKGGVNKRHLIPSLEWVNGYPSVYYTFLSNMVHQGVQDYVIPFPLPSQMAGRFLDEAGVSFDILHIDGAHNYEDALQDIETWWRLLQPGGVVIGDDYMPYAPGVARAANEVAKREGAKIFQDGVQFVILKPGGASTPPYFIAEGVRCRGAPGGRWGGALCHPDQFQRGGPDADAQRAAVG